MNKFKETELIIWLWNNLTEAVTNDFFNVR